MRISGSSPVKATLLAAGMMFAWGAVAFAQGADVKGKGETVRIQEYPGSIGFGQELLWVAVDKRFCEAHGIKCELVKVQNGSLGLQAMTAGSIDFNYVTADLDIQAAVRGVDLQLVVGTEPRLYLTLDASKKVLPDGPKPYPEVMHALKGKKVGVAARGAATEVQVRALLDGAGMSASDVTFVAIGAPGTAYSAFAAGTVDAAMSWPPFAQVCHANNDCVHAVELSHQGPEVLQKLNGAVQVLAATRSYIDKNPTTVRAFVQALRDAAAWTRDPKNFDELVKVTKNHFSLGDIPDADKVLEDILKYEQKNAGVTIDRAAVQATAEYLYKYKVIDAPFDTSKLVYEHAPKP
jgi:NitT/TauT family transport system substrate-binding protein